jgi:hypothetical protein
MPEPPAVTIATLPSSLPVINLLSRFNRYVHIHARKDAMDETVREALPASSFYRSQKFSPAVSLKVRAAILG